MFIVEYKVSHRKYVCFFYSSSFSKCIQIFWDSLQYNKTKRLIASNNGYGCNRAISNWFHRWISYPKSRDSINYKITKGKPSNKKQDKTYRMVLDRKVTKSYLLTHSHTPNLEIRDAIASEKSLKKEIVLKGWFLVKKF